jgi:hypothetical protein
MQDGKTQPTAKEKIDRKGKRMNNKIESREDRIKGSSTTEYEGE